MHVHFKALWLQGVRVSLKCGEIPEWPNGADCKSAVLRLRRFESFFPHKLMSEKFKIYLTVNAGVAQLVERQPSKLQVACSNLVSRSYRVVKK